MEKVYCPAEAHPKKRKRDRDRDGFKKKERARKGDTKELDRKQKRVLKESKR